MNISQSITCPLLLNHDRILNPPSAFAMCQETLIDSNRISTNKTTPTTGELWNDQYFKNALKGNNELSWSNINWSRISSRVNKLQSRIAKAVILGDYRLVKRLQYLLQNSFYAKLIAVRRVTSNKGKRTSGIDGKLWSTATSKWKAVLSLVSKKFRASPLKRVFIEKKVGANESKNNVKKKKRALGIPTMYDRAMQSLFALTLEPVAETTADHRSFGFRKYRSCHDAGKQIFNCLSGKNGAEWILEGDIKGCFDNINHQWLLDNIPMDKKILKQFLKAGYSLNKGKDKGKLFPTEKGTPQGGIISPTLANMTLDGIEGILLNKYWTSNNKNSSRYGRSRYTGKIDRQYNKSKVNFIRYADDFIVTAKTREVAQEIKSLIKQFLTMRGLTLSETKTKITHIQDGFDFLGWNIRKFNKFNGKDKNKLRISPSKESCKNIADKIKTIIKKGSTFTQDQLIKILNPVIRGWCNYHRGMVSKAKFQHLDIHIFKAIWQWAKRRHPMKSRHWIKDRYFTRIDNETRSRDWIFRGETTQLIFASDTKIKRHKMIKLNKNPFLKVDQGYFAYRFSGRMQ